MSNSSNQSEKISITKIKSVQFVFNNPTVNDVMVDLFDTAAPELPTSPYAAPPSSALPPLAVGNTPTAVGYSSASNKVYVINNGSDNVTVVDGITNNIITTIAVGTAPSNVAYNSIDNTIYVTNNGSSDISIIDCNIDSVINTISVGVGFQLTGIAFNSNNNTMYVCRDDLFVDEVVIVDCVSQALSGSPISFPSSLLSIAYNSILNRMYVSVGFDVYVIDCFTNTFIGSPIAVGVGGGEQIIFNAATTKMYVSSISANTVLVIDCNLNSIVATIPVGSQPRGMSANSGGLLYVANFGDNTVSVVNCVLNIVTNTLLVGTQPRGVGYNSVRNIIYVTNQTDDTITIIANILAIYADPYPNYNQFTQDLNDNPKSIKQIILFGSSLNQAFQTINILNSDANGQKYSMPKYPTNDFSADQFQKNIVVNFSKEELVLSNGGSIISQYLLRANSSVTMLIYYVEIKKINLIYAGHKSILEKLVDETSPNIDEEIKEQYEINEFNQPYLRVLWDQPFSNTKAASEMLERQLSDIKQLSILPNM